MQTTIMNEYNNAINQLKKIIPTAIKNIEKEKEQCTLLEYSKKYPCIDTSLQDKDDIIMVAEKKASMLYSTKIALDLRHELEDRFIALTANHHGLDFHTEFLQGNYIFALACKKAIPLFAWGGVPSDNISFPRGILLSPREKNTYKLFRFPLLSNTSRREFVSIKNAYTIPQIQNITTQLPILTQQEQHIITKLINNIYLCPRVLNQKNFSEQMSIANYLLWNELTNQNFQLPPLVCLELQELTKELIIKDLQTPYTLIHDLIIEPEFTRTIYTLLNGERSCWLEENGTINKGSFLFWGINEKKHNIRLSYNIKNHTLENTNSSHKSYPLKKDALITALKNGEILPTLFLSYAVTSIARGLSCAGGVFQCEYLPTMAKGIHNALLACHEESKASLIKVKSPFNTGLLPLHTKFPLFPHEDDTCPASAIDILTHNGITEKIWEQLAATTVKKTFYSAIPYHYEDLIAKQDHIHNWQKTLSISPPITLD